MFSGQIIFFINKRIIINNIVIDRDLEASFFAVFEWEANKNSFTKRADHKKVFNFRYLENMEVSIQLLTIEIGIKLSFKVSIVVRLVFLYPVILILFIKIS